MSGNPTYNDILNYALLNRAWLDVKAKGTLGGIDGQDIDNFALNAEKNLNDIIFDLKNEQWKPYPYQKISIPKSDGTLRTLGMLTVKDKIVQGALKEIIEPLFEPSFLDCSYAYRHDKGHVKAVKRIVHVLKSSKPEWIISCDIKNFFDTLDHSILERLIKERLHDEKLLHLVKLSYIMGRVDKKGNWIESNSGVPQGGILSPLFSNIYLNHFDHAITTGSVQLVRYADDFILLCTNKTEAEAVLTKTFNVIEHELKLTLKKEFEITEVKNGFTFLGITFNLKGIGVAEKKLESMSGGLNKLPLLQNESLHIKLQEKIRGYHNYYGRLLPDSELYKIDEVIFKSLGDRILKNYQSKQISKALVKKILSGIEYLSVQFKKEVFKRVKSEFLKYTSKPEIESGKSRKIPLEVLHRKREYQDLQSQGMDLVIVRQGSFLSKTKDKITVKHSGKIITEVNATNLRAISIASNGIIITSNLIEFCMEHNIAIDFFDFKGTPYAKIHASIQNSIETGLHQIMGLKNGKAEAFCKILVQSKIYNQTAYIKYHSKYRKYLSKEWDAILAEAISKMDVIALSIKNLVYTSIEDLRGKLLAAEGRAASCYWGIVELLIKHKIPSFTGRERKGAGDLFNSMLNYGYSIMYARLWSCIIRSGLNPGISYMHVEQINKPTLVYDLIEQFRVQAVEKPLIAMCIKEFGLKIDATGYLTEDTKRRVVEKVLERMNTFEMFRGKEMRLIDIFQQQTDDFCKYISGEIKTYKPYLMKW